MPGAAHGMPRDVACYRAYEENTGLNNKQEQRSGKLERKKVRHMRGQSRQARAYEGAERYECCREHAETDAATRGIKAERVQLTAWQLE